MSKTISAAMVFGGAALLAALGGGVAMASAQAPAAAKNIAYFANAHWDDDHDDVRAPRTAMPIPSEAALKRAGMVRVTEVERDDGQLEVEGYDKDGREMDIKMDASGQRVLHVEYDDDRRLFRR